MLFDPSADGGGVASGETGTWQPPRGAAARCRPAAGFLTLPSIGAAVPATGRLRWCEDLALSGLVAQHFRHGPLRAWDVRLPAGAGDAFQQAFFAWYRRQTAHQFQRLVFSPELFDAHALREHLNHCQTETNDDDAAPLFFGIELPEEWVYQVEMAAMQLRAAHPLLLGAVFDAIGRASARTLFLRLPDWYMYEFACWYWDGDESISDAEAEEFLSERFGEDNETRHAYLPSEVRPVLYPDELRVNGRLHSRRRRAQFLGATDIARLRPRLSGLPRRVCTQLLVLDGLLRSSRTRDLFNVQYQTNPVYSAASLVLTDNRWIGDLLDTHYENEANMGEATTHHGFTALAAGAKAIRRQYADWSLALQVLVCLDRLLTLVSQPI